MRIEREKKFVLLSVAVRLLLQVAGIFFFFFFIIMYFNDLVG